MVLSEFWTSQSGDLFNFFKSKYNEGVGEVQRHIATLLQNGLHGVDRDNGADFKNEITARSWLIIKG